MDIAQDQRIGFGWIVDRDIIGYLRSPDGPALPCGTEVGAEGYVLDGDQVRIGILKYLSNG